MPTKVENDTGGQVVAGSKPVSPTNVLVVQAGFGVIRHRFFLCLLGVCGATGSATRSKACSQAKRSAQPVDGLLCCVVGGGAVDVASDANRGVSEEIGQGLMCTPDSSHAVA